MEQWQKYSSADIIEILRLVTNMNFLTFSLTLVLKKRASNLDLVLHSEINAICTLQHWTVGYLYYLTSNYPVNSHIGRQHLPLKMLICLQFQYVEFIFNRYR